MLAVQIQRQNCFLQVMNREAKRLEKEIKEVLDEMGTDSEAKNRLLTGK